MRNHKAIFTPDAGGSDAFPIDFIFKRNPEIYNHRTVWVVGACISFDRETADTDPVQMYFSDDESENFDTVLIEKDSSGKASIYLELQQPIPINENESIKIKYNNPNRRTVSINIRHFYR